VQQAYWKEHSQGLTVEAMMLDSQASILDKMERPEVGAAAATSPGGDSQKSVACPLLDGPRAPLEPSS
jgi:hypothetical protein